MKRSVGLGLLSAMFLAGSGVSNAIELKGVEHNIDLGLGYTAQIYSGDSAYKQDMIDRYENAGQTLTNLTNQISLYVGYNAVFKMNKFFNPILGAFMSGHIPLNYTMKLDEYNQEVKNMLSNVFDLNLKLGNRFNICKDVNIDLYYFVGFSAGISKSKSYSDQDYEDYGESKSQSKTKGYAGLSTGVGVDASYKNIVLGIYYKYTDMRLNELMRFKSNNVGIKVGYRFAL